MRKQGQSQYELSDEHLAWKQNTLGLYVYFYSICRKIKNKGLKKL